MTSYLRSWLLGAPSEPTPTPLPEIRNEPPEIEIIEPVEDEGRNSDDDGYDTDRPPAFPAINSPQRASTSSKSTSNTLSKGLMGPPPPRLGTQARSLSAQVNEANSLAPLTTTKIAKKSKKVALAPGHSTLDWANLKTSGEDLRVRLYAQSNRRWYIDVYPIGGSNFIAPCYPFNAQAAQ